MTGLWNKDTSFFEVGLPDLKSDGTEIISRDTVSLTVTESMGGVTQGQITLNDPYCQYPSLLPPGTRMVIAWGYRAFDEGPRVDLAAGLNQDEFTGSTERRGLEVITQSPTGGGAQNGAITFNCGFIANQWVGADRRIVHRGPTRGDVVSGVLEGLGVAQSRRYVVFDTSRQSIGENAGVVQQETDFAFLARIAREWRCQFAMGTGQDGAVYAMFCDPGRVATAPHARRVLGVAGRGCLYDYKGQVSNVMSYAWKNKFGESGFGDAVQMRIINGEPQFYRYVAETRSFVTYRLSDEQISAEFERVGADGGVGAQVRWWADVQSAGTFEEVKRFFVESAVETAPQGAGYEVDLKMVGNPLVVPSGRARFSGAFPAEIGAADTTWYNHEVVHRISQQGYSLDVKVVDAFSLSPTGVVL